MSAVNLHAKDAAGARARAAADEQRMFRRPSEWRIFWEAFSRDRLAVGAAAVIALVCLASLVAPIISPYDPTVGDNSLRLAPIGTPGPPARARWTGAGHPEPPALGRAGLARHRPLAGEAWRA